MADNVCMSGGAKGADLAWGNNAREAGHRVVHFSFDGHKSKAKPTELIELSEKQLLSSDPFVTQAIIDLKRAPLHTRTPLVQALLQRNWWQVRDADACFAVSSFRKGKVAGGTGYAVQMFINRGVMSKAAGPWVFDQEKNQWFCYNRSWARWDAVDAPPRPEGKYAGIGTRDINALGLRAIERVYE